MNSLTQNPHLLNSPSLHLDYFLSLLNAPFTSRLSPIDYGYLMQNVSSWMYCFLRKVFVSVIEKADMEFRNSQDRIHRFYVKQTRPRTIITIFGEITFTRTEYQRRDTGESYCYIDRKLSLLPRQRYDCLVEAKAKELYADHNSMIKTGKILGEQINSFFSLDPNRKFFHIPRQTIYNLLHRRGKILLQPATVKYTPDTLYIMADEKWIPLQGECTSERQHIKEMVKMAICFEGKENILRKDGTSTDRFQLKNKYIYGACTSERNNFWESLLNQLSYRYDLNKVKKIYILGDGGSWIKNGVQFMKMSHNEVKAALDRFHANQAIHRMTSDKAFQDILTRHLYELNREEFDTVAEIARSYCTTDKEIETFENNLNYIHRHWNEFKVMMKEVKIGCSMEQAISHILASHFTSVPKAYSRKNLPLYLNSRLLSENKEDVLLTHLMAIEKAQDTKEDITLHEEYDFSFFDDQIRDETSSINLRNRSHAKQEFPF